MENFDARNFADFKKCNEAHRLLMGLRNEIMEIETRLRGLEAERNFLTLRIRELEALCHPDRCERG